MALSLKSIIKGWLLRDETDQSKQMEISISSSATTSTKTILQASQTANRTLNLPDATDTLVGKATTDTLTNKTLNGNTATNLISGSGTLTLNTTGTITVPNGTDTLVGKTTTDTLTNKTLTAPVINGATSISVDNLTLDGNTISSTNTDGNIILDPNGTGLINVSAARVTNLGAPISASDAATMQYVDDQTTGSGGPEFQDNQFRITDNGDTTKKLAFEVSGITTLTTRTWTVPNTNLTIPTTIASGTLNNLGTTAINASLLFGADATYDIGSTSAAPNNIYTRLLNLDNSSGNSSILITGIGGAVTTPLTAPQIVGRLNNGATVLALTSLNDATVDSNATGTIAINTGNKTAGTGNSGNIVFTTGTSSGGTRGQVQIDASKLQMTASLISGVLDPVSAQDAATKNYVDTKFVSLKVTDSGNQTISNNTTTLWTPDTETFDSTNSWNTGTSTFTTPYTGKYEIIGFQWWDVPADPWAAGNEALLVYRVNGAGSYYPITVISMQAAFSSAVKSNGTAPLVNLTATDTVQIFAYQNSGGNVALAGGVDGTAISIHKVSD